MAAKTIEPSIGASTWALGSHRWNINIGSFTRKAKINSNGKFNKIEVFSAKIMFELGNIIVIARRSGMEAKIVYINKNSLALFRSGWFPDFIINMNVGIMVSSNEM